MRTEALRFCALLGACGLAIAQPVLDAFGKSPETFIFRNAEGFDVVLFAVVIVLVPPLALWWFGMVVGFIAPRWRVLVHAATLGVLVALAVLQALAALPMVVTVVVAGLVGLAVWVLTVRAAAFRQWAQLLAGLPVFALVAFLVFSPASDVVGGGEFEAAATEGEVAPVVLIVLDELPTASIIDANGAIDAVRFPNLARFATDATWYRNHTTQSGFTDSAVPAALTGRRPEDVPPLFTRHPDTVFRLLAGSHDLVVSESMTRLCPTSVCGETPRAPSVSEPVEVDAAMAGLFGDAFDLWLERVGGSSGSPSFDDFEEEVAGQVETVAATSAFGEGEAPTSRGSWEAEVASHPSRLADFLAALTPGDRPVGAVIHLVSPHFPWHFLPDGQSYAKPAAAAGLDENQRGDPWIRQLERQRHLLQASYTDRLVGQILGRLEDTDVYDDAAIAVTADHGISFTAEPNRRLATTEAMPEIAWTPLLVKAPHQTDGAVDDSNMQIVDVVPTLAKLAGIKIPWSVDGVAAASPEITARGDVKPFRRFKSLADPEPSHDVEIDGAAGFAAMLDLAPPAIRPEDDPVVGLYRQAEHGRLFGQEFRPVTDITPDVLAVDDLDRLRDGSEPVLVLSGSVASRGSDADAVVAAVDGRIIGVSPIIDRDDGGQGFVMLLATAEPFDIGRVHLGLVTGSSVRDAGALAD